ncbi:hypothetical protein V5O48_012504 [Marasmius crinis-equi]|uniref:Integrase core domain-containing protein n=1 Tax=Marasmius crinis-equi TaxID=585013 RepID=A0ABR3F2M9_9AGAR
MCPSREQEIVDNFRHAYEEIGHTVSTVLRTGNIPQIPEITRECLSFFQRVQQHYRKFDPDELETITSSIMQMILHLDNARNVELDPPDRTFPFPSPPSDDTPRQRGRPRAYIDPGLLALAVDLRQTRKLADILNVHVRTLRRRALEQGLVEPGHPVYVNFETEDGVVMRVYRSSTGPMTDISDDDLDDAMHQIITAFPSFGRHLIQGELKFMGIHVPRSWVEASYLRVVDLPTQSFGIWRITRRIYTVPGPNSLWHHDGQHGIRAHNNNRADTVLDLFTEAIQVHGCPSRARGDHGTENVMVVEFMEAMKGSGRGSYIFGKSIHNIRIERLWRDVTLGFGGKWKYFFEKLEQHEYLNCENSAHIWLLHFLFLDAINHDALRWAEAWNRHKMALRHQPSASPTEMFVFGMMENGIRGMDEVWNFNDDDRVNLSSQEDLDAYGIDWEAIDDRAVYQHHQTHNHPDNEGEPFNPFSTYHPNLFSHVEVEPPTCPLEPPQIDILKHRLQLLPYIHQQDIESRRLLWHNALFICAELIEV